MKLAKFKTHYDNLKVAKNAPIEVIKAAYKVLCQKHHPDRNQDNPDSTRIMKIINEAYEVLSDPVKRLDHDRWIESQEKKYQQNNSKNQAENDRENKAAQERARQAHAEQQRKAQAYAEQQRKAQADAEQQRKAQADAEQQRKAQADAEKQRVEEANKIQKERRVIVLIVISIVCVAVVSFLAINVYNQKASLQTNTQYDSSSLKNESESAVDTSLINTAPIDPVTYPTSFNCDAAKSTPETLICSQAELAQKDRELAILVEQARAAVSDKKSFKDRLRRQWNYREKNCIDIDCLNDWFTYQKNILMQIAATGNVRAGLTENEMTAQALPQTGYTNQSNLQGEAPLQVRVPYGSDHYYIKLENPYTKQEIASYFIRSGSTLNIHLPIGTYAIKYAYGQQWYGTDDLFGPNTQYAKANQYFEFRFDGYQYNGYSIELIKQVNGNLQTSSIDPNQF